MKLRTLTITGTAGLIATGLLALPVAAFADRDQMFKRDDDTPGVTQVPDDLDDEDDLTRMGVARADRDTRTGKREKNTRTRDKFTRSKDRSRTGSRSGRDNSRNKKVRDWTRDGGDRTRDRSRNSTNDRSRNNTR